MRSEKEKGVYRQMKNIIAIFKDDVQGLRKNILALVIALGVCVLPSLYGWFNIYSNWDPYANTSKVPIAVCSEDAGYVKSDGTQVNMGEKVLEQLHENDKLGWQFPQTAQEAIDGVYSGEYYAALVIEEDFSESMYACLANGMEHPKIQYYENEKRNAIAIKITDSGSSSLQSSINTEFVDVVVTALSENMSEIAGEDEESIITGVETKIRKVNDNLIAYETLLGSFMECNVELSDSILGMKDLLPKIQSAINSSVASVNSTKTKVNEVSDKVGDAANNITGKTASITNTVLGVKLNEMSVAAVATNQAINQIQAELSKNSSDKSVIADNLKAASDNFSTMAGAASDLYDTLDGMDADENNADYVDALTQLSKVKLAAKASQAAAEEAASALDKASDVADTTHKVVNEVADFNRTVISAGVDQIVAQVPTINSAIYGDLSSKVANAANSVQGKTNEVKSSVDKVTKQSASVDIDEDGLAALLDSVSNSLLAGNIALDNSKLILGSTTDKLSKILDEIEGVTEGEKYQKLLDIMKNDPALYGEFLSQPINVTTVPVYETATYGEAVTPFYTTLALWVGAIILVAIIKVHATPKNTYQDATHYELFFGRYLMFFCLGQIQSFICIWGDLHLLNVQCHDTGKMYLAGALISFTFTLLIYTLTLSFGDIGKAFAVVIMVIQIAGSSGTYPIELLPDIFQAIYQYFPFPYAINAIREVISGMYENDYQVYLGGLLLFAAGALLVGLVIRVPFMKLNHFIEQRMEDTKMM